MEFDVNKFDVAKYDEILACGLSSGLGTRGKQVCIEAAICQVLELPHGDNPRCVSRAVRAFKIRLNDSRWTSPASRAKGMRDLGLAQLGSKGVVDDVEFAKLVAKKTTRRILPMLYRQLWPNDAGMLAAAQRCEDEGTVEAARAARDAANKKRDVAAYVAAYAAAAADAAADAAAAAAAAADAAADAAAADKYLVLSAQLALEALRELNSPGIALIRTGGAE